MPLCVLHGKEQWICKYIEGKIRSKILNASRMEGFYGDPIKDRFFDVTLRNIFLNDIKYSSDIFFAFTLI